MTAGTLTKLCIEHPIPQTDGQKIQYTFDTSNVRYIRRGFHRHFFSHEAMRLKSKFLYNTLPLEQRTAVMHMLTYGGELYHTSIESVGNHILLTDDPKLAFEGKEYAKLRQNPAPQAFYTGNLPKDERITAEEIAKTNEELVQRLWSVHYRDMHSEMKTGAYLIIPSQGVWPIASSSDNLSFGLEPVAKAASRGMKFEEHVNKPRIMITEVHHYAEYAGMAARQGFISAR